MDGAFIFQEATHHQRDTATRNTIEIASECKVVRSRAIGPNERWAGGKPLNKESCLENVARNPTCFRFVTLS